MRHYEHVYHNREIMKVDPISARAVYGTHFPEYMNPEERHWLRQGHTNFPRQETVFQLSNESGPSCSTDDGGFIIVEAQGCDGFYYEGAIHKSKIEWEKGY